MNTKNQKLISIIIPYYNSKAKYFLEASQSIIDQIYHKWEAIIVNDGSNIESRDFLYKTIESFNDNRFSIINLEKNCGVSQAKNTGIKHANGELITFLDPDDFLLPWDLEKITGEFNKSPDCLILSTDYLYYLKFGPIQKIYRSYVFDKFLKSKEKNADISGFILPRLILKKEVFNELKFDCNLHRGEDTDLLIQILNNNNLLKKLTLYKETGYIYRFYPSKKRLTHNLHFRLNTWEVLKNKYQNEENYLVQNMIKSLESNIFEMKYHSIIVCYLTYGSIIRSLKEIIRNYKTIKEKIKCLIALTKVIIEQKYLMPLFGINLKFVDILINLKKNYKKAEDIEYYNVNLRKV